MSDVIRHLMQVAHHWADEPNDPEHGRSDTLEIELRKALAGKIDMPVPERGGLLLTLSVHESEAVPADEIHLRDNGGRLLARVIGIAGAKEA